MSRTLPIQHNRNVLEIRSEHRLIYEAVRERSSEAAVQAIQDHLVAAKNRVVHEMRRLQGADVAQEG